MISDKLKLINSVDSEVSLALESELKRQQHNIELIASENIVSRAVMETLGTWLTNKYAEGYPGHRYYGGCEHIDTIEQLAINRACELFGAEHANVQPHSGANANLAVYQALLKPGDTILSMSLSNGGHLTHGAPANVSGKLYNIVNYEVDENGYIDYDDIWYKILEYHPKLVLAGASAYSRVIDFERIYNTIEKFDEKYPFVGRPYFMVDMAHIAGLVAAGVHPSPVPYADVVTSTTHKTLRGPRGGLILCKNSLAKKIDSAVFPGTQGGPLEHVIAAKAVCFKEAMQPEFKEYANQIVKNAKVLSEVLINNGFNIVTNGTDNHLILVDTRNFGITGKELEQRLDSCYITVNKNSIPNDPEKITVTSGIRIGTPAVTSRGMKEHDMALIGELITLIAEDYEMNKEYVTSKVLELTSKYPIYE